MVTTQDPTVGAVVELLEDGAVVAPGPVQQVVQRVLELAPALPSDPGEKAHAAACRLEAIVYNQLPPQVVEMLPRAVQNALGVLGCG